MTAAMHGQLQIYAIHTYSTNFIAELEGKATNLDAQVAERLYICIYVRHSQLRTPRSWPRNHICSYLLFLVAPYIFITF